MADELSIDILVEIVRPVGTIFIVRSNVEPRPCYCERIGPLAAVNGQFEKPS